MSRTTHHGNTSRNGKDLWGKYGNGAGKCYDKVNRKNCHRFERQAAKRIIGAEI